MKISKNWLQNYLEFDLTTDQLSEILTNIGLEVEGIEKVESIKGRLEGIVIGEIVDLSQHPNADRLKLTKVDVGHAEPLSIVCGAPNVAKGQKVVVALVGTTLYPDEKGFKIKKSKIRGEVSEGMLCAEDEIGLGSSHDGIMVLDQAAKVGQAASSYFNLESDLVFEIGLTPNRVDAASHWGVARDLAAYLKLTEDIELKEPARASLPQSEECPIKVEIKNTDACPRYSGIFVEGLKIEDSPEWLQNSLKSIGLSPINNVVDITNYIMHEMGQPLHAFDAAKIKGDKVIVQNLSHGTKFTTLDKEERELSEEDLMICNEVEGMCIAGVFGGIHSGVTESTQSIFLESAYFNPVSIRKTAKRHGLNTDASFRYERGADPNITIKALERAAYLLKEIAGGRVVGKAFDYYPNPVEDFLVSFNYQNLDRLLGQKIERSLVKQILQNLGIQILHEEGNELRLNVPPYRVDVQREVDVIEEVLRIYGYNQIELPKQMQSAIINQEKLPAHELEDTISDLLSNNGFAEIFNNSLTNPKYYQEDKHVVKMVNPLSKETEVMRASMLYGGLETIAYNQNRKRKNLKLYEFGKTYHKFESGYQENKQLAIWLSGDQSQESWQGKQAPVDFYNLKSNVELILNRLGINNLKQKEVQKTDSFSYGLDYLKGKRKLASLSLISKKELNQFDIQEEVYFASIDWDAVLEVLSNKEIQYQPVSKFPTVRRDLALLIDQTVSFDAIQKLSKQTEQKLLQSVNLFDVYEGNKLESGKKSYGVSFVFQDPNKTLTDKQIDKIMSRLVDQLKSNLGADLR